MKILHAAETIKGGVSTVLNQLINHQANQNRIICITPRNHSEFLTDAATVKKIFFSKKNRSILALLQFSFCLTKTILTERPDIVHLHSSFAGTIGRITLLLLKPIAKPKIIYCPHGWSFNMETGAWKKIVYAKVEKALSYICSNIVCISNHEAISAALIGIPNAKLHIIRNGVSTKAVENSPLSQGKIRILFVGRFDPQKGFDIAIETMKMLDSAHFHLTVVGSGVLKQVKDDTLPNVDYHGWKAQSDLSEQYIKADVVIVPSRWEGFGLVAAEAMAHGTPVLASNVGGLPEIVIAGKTGYLVQPVASEFVKILNSTSKLKWRGMREDCVKHIQLYFDQARMNNEIDLLYLKTLSEKS